MSVDPKLANRFKTAWNNLSPAEQSRIQPHMDRAYGQLKTFLQQRRVPYDPRVRRELLLAQCVVTNDQERTFAAVDALAAQQSVNISAGVHVDSGGNIWGAGKFQELDPGWFEAGVIWIENLVLKRPNPFGTAIPKPIPIPDTATIVLAGDFGTGDWGGTTPAASTKIRKLIPPFNPHVTIHLGDVYYAGTNSSELGNLVSLWPAGSVGALTLNSNHEMYPGAVPYFQEALTSPVFSIQQQRSFFALENANWIIVGLDSAYFSDPDGLYMDGTLDSQIQLPFLASMAKTWKKIVILTHHNGLSEDGGTQQPLWTQVMSVFPAGTAPQVWYWGHVHAGVIYNSPAGVSTLCRCIGHGALPYGNASILANNGRVLWFEKNTANDPNDPQRVLNGFAVLQFTGQTLKETWYDENGHQAWPE
ncbi:MAG: metallophosphoesterase [Candidatus Acidiferrales bacterium]